MQTEQEYIRQNCNQGIILGLDTMRTLMKTLGSLENRIPAVQVAGTNGKGSVCTYLASILRQAGLRVGCFNSPAVFDPYEIISVNGKNITEDEYEKLAGRVAQVMRQWKSEEADNQQAIMPTAFEAETAIAYLHFYEQNCDLAVIETGLGGDLDATNVTQSNLCSIFTSISLDHTGILGGTLEEIAGHKAGIIKRNSAVVIGRQKEEVLSVLRKRTQELQSDIRVCKEVYPEEIDKQTGNIRFSYNGRADLSVTACGLYQMENAAIAIEAADAIRQMALSVPERYEEVAPENWQRLSALSQVDWEECIRKGLAAAHWHGRLEKLSENPLFLMDGAHNPDAARRLAETLESCYCLPRIFLFGMFADKDYKKVARTVIQKEIAVFTVTPDGSRGLDASVLAQTVREFSDCEQIEAMPDVRTGVENAVAFARQYQEESGVYPMILAFGSLSWLKQCKEAAEGILGRWDLA